MMVLSLALQTQSPRHSLQFTSDGDMVISLAHIGQFFQQHCTETEL